MFNSWSPKDPRLPSNAELSACFVTEFIPNESLETHLQNYHKGIDKTTLNSTRRTKIIFGIAAIMKKFHNHKVIHRSLKPSQILLNEDFEPVIKYSSLSRIITDTHDMTMGVGTILYMAPEQYQKSDQQYGLPVDVYSFAIILYQIFSRQPLLEARGKLPTPQQLMMDVFKGKRPKRDSCIPDCYWQLIEKCWKTKPQERPTFAEITEILKDDQYILHDCGEPDLKEIFRYQNEIDN